MFWAVVLTLIGAYTLTRAFLDFHLRRLFRSTGRSETFDRAVQSCKLTECVQTPSGKVCLSCELALTKLHSEKFILQGYCARKCVESHILGSPFPELITQMRRVGLETLGDGIMMCELFLQPLPRR
jgi:hypothetical protein